MNKSKSLVLAIASLALTFTSLIPAQAADTSLTYIQFIKINAKSVSNGIKLTGKYKGVTGNLCVTAVKSIASTKNCK